METEVGGRGTVTGSGSLGCLEIDTLLRSSILSVVLSVLFKEAVSICLEETVKVMKKYW